MAILSLKECHLPFLWSLLKTCDYEGCFNSSKYIWSSVCFVNQFKLISESILKPIQRFACLISQITFMLVYVLYIMCHDKQQNLL